MKKCLNCAVINSYYTNFCFSCGQSSFKTQSSSAAISKTLEGGLKLRNQRFYFLICSVPIFLCTLLFLIRPIFDALSVSTKFLGDPPPLPVNGYVFRFWGKWIQFFEGEVIAEGGALDWSSFPLTVPFFIIIGLVLVFLLSVFVFYKHKYLCYIFGFVKFFGSVLGFVGMLQMLFFGFNLSQSIPYFRFTLGFYSGMLLFLLSLLQSFFILIQPDFFISRGFFTIFSSFDV